MSRHVPPGTKHYGRVRLSTTGREAWEAQDATKAWDDAGEVRATVQTHTDRLIADLEGVVAKNATLGASEYLAEGEGTLTMSPEGEILVGLRVHNDDAQFIAHVPLRPLVFSALQDMRTSLALDPRAQAVLSQLIALGRQLASLGQPPKASPQTTPQQDTAA